MAAPAAPAVADAGNEAGILNIPQLLFQRVDLLGERTAMRLKEFGLWQDISWNTYGEKVRQAAMGVAALGVEPGDTVAVIGENRPEWLFADLGVMAAGGVTTGIYTTNAAEECGYILSHSQAKVYIVEDEEQLDKALEVRGECPNLSKIVVIDTEGLRHFSDPMVMDFEELLALGREHDAANPGLFEARLAARGPDDLALLIYTSGTTGPPKGAMLSHNNVLWTTKALAQAIPVYQEDELLSFLPLSHIAERMFSVYMHLRFMYTVNFIENTDTVTENVVEVSPTVFFAVPRIWEKYSSSIYIKMKDATWFKRLVFALALKIGKRRAKARLSEQGVGAALGLAFALAHAAVFKKLKERLGLERVRLAVSGAAPISPDVLRFYHAIGLPLRQVYGQTEDTGPTSIHHGDLIEAENVGPAVPGVEVKIAPDGEILVKGENVFLGYYRNPEATAETLEDGWLHSGDVGELDQRGYLTITDRKKDLIITSGGKNIAPQYLENKLKFSPYINDAVVIGDQRKFVSALVFIDEDNVFKYAQDNKIPFTTYASLTQAKEVKELIAREIEDVNKTLARVEQIKRFTILPKKLLEEDGEVTPTMKVKRKYINETYADMINAMYR
ncbi:MAG: AMP-binding protein [Desulfarculus sp.]|nr:AMP-binding protein [Pseudomonadota bacterium]MBV1716658.1 AMP-binding protein [Desulfarculus sp.]MBU4573954.1 AMP-binding protein [Pseudomonadota bacterium]MBU4597039.1 AMP-binding protein [Pseudomonadota bacterium]MBV1739334.1 AMP-binding protein [Desulfarculus sp.]